MERLPHPCEHSQYSLALRLPLTWRVAGRGFPADVGGHGHRGLRLEIEPQDLAIHPLAHRHGFCRTGEYPRLFRSEYGVLETNFLFILTLD